MYNYWHRSCDTMIQKYRYFELYRNSSKISFIHPSICKHLISAHQLWPDNHFHWQQREEHLRSLFLGWVVSAAGYHCCHSISKWMRSSHRQLPPSECCDHWDKWTTWICWEAFVLGHRHIDWQPDRYRGWHHPHQPPYSLLLLPELVPLIRPHLSLATDKPNVLFEGISWRGEVKTDSDEWMAQRINWCKTLNSVRYKKLEAMTMIVLWYKVLSSY